MKVSIFPLAVPLIHSLVLRMETILDIVFFFYLSLPPFSLSEFGISITRRAHLCALRQTGIVSALVPEEEEKRPEPEQRQHDRARAASEWFSSGRRPRKSFAPAAPSRPPLDPAVVHRVKHHMAGALSLSRLLACSHSHAMFCLNADYVVLMRPVVRTSRV